MIGRAHFEIWFRHDPAEQAVTAGWSVDAGPCGSLGDALCNPGDPTWGWRPRDLEAHVAETVGLLMALRTSLAESPLPEVLRPGLARAYWEM